MNEGAAFVDVLGEKQSGFQQFLGADVSLALASILGRNLGEATTASDTTDSQLINNALAMFTPYNPNEDMMQDDAVLPLPTRDAPPMQLDPQSPSQAYQPNPM